jgi:autotransporter-associated beta strand protein
MKKVLLPLLSVGVFISVTCMGSVEPAFAGHLFTQASSNTPTWIQQGKGIAIKQYGAEGSSGSGDISINFEMPSGGIPAEATQTGDDWWQWSAGDVMKINLPLADATYTYTIAYDADANCSYSYCGVTGGSSLNIASSTLGNSGVTLPAHSGEVSGGGYTSSDTYFGWSVVSVAGEFALGGYRLYTAGGVIDGTGAGPLTQDSVVTEEEVDEAVGGGPRPINANDDTDTGLGTITTYVFDGGTLNTAVDIANDFTITGNGGSVGVGDGNSATMSGILADDGSAPGALTKSGDGTLTLSGANTYSGGTSVAGGTLRVSSDDNLGATTAGVTLDGGTLATIADISTARAFTFGLGNGTLEVADGTTLETSGTLNGSGNGTKSGTGKLEFTGTSTLMGSMDVAAGNLSVNGLFGSSLLTVQQNASLSGSGSIASDVLVYGTLRPGNSPGTLTVAGDMTLTNLSNFEVDVDGRVYNPAGGAGSYDRLLLTGATSVFTAAGTLTPVLRGITGAATNAFNAIVGDRFRIVTTADNSNGVVGAFDTVVTPTEGIVANGRFSAVYGASYVDLVVVADSLEALLQSTGIVNAISAGTGLDTLQGSVGTGNADVDALFNGLVGLDAAQTSAATLQLSGEIHAFALADARQAMSNGSDRLMFGAMNRVTGRNLWVDTSGYRLEEESDTFASKSKAANRLIWAGLDIQQDDALTFGLALGYSGGDLHAGLSGESKRDTSMFAVYGYGSSGRVVYDASLSLGNSKIRGDRSVALATGTESNSFEAKNTSVQAAGRVGYKVDVSEKIAAMPWVSAEVNWTHAPGYAETGSTITGLTVAEDDYRSAVIKAGVDLGGQFFSTQSSKASWSSSFGLSHTLGFGDTYATRDVSLNGTTWNVTESHDGKTAAFAKFGLSYSPNPDSQFWANVGISRGEGQRQDWISSGMSLRF